MNECANLFVGFMRTREVKQSLSMIPLLVGAETELKTLDSRPPEYLFLIDCFQAGIASAPMGILAHLGKTLSYRSVADFNFRRNLPHACPCRGPPVSSLAAQREFRSFGPWC
jgi:hypothetical protein